MSQDVFKAPKAKRSHPRKDLEPWSPGKRRKIKDRFLNFCDIVLSYTKYESIRQEDLRARNNTSPLDSGGSTADSFTSESAGSSYLDEESQARQEAILRTHSFGHDVAADEDSWDLVTCFCGKPFAGRPMIECSRCEIWVHLSCAKIRRSNIPDTFVCIRCKNNKAKRKSRPKIEKMIA